MTDLKLPRLGVWGHLDSLETEGVRRYAQRVEELGYGTLWVPETVGREPFTLLGMLGAWTSRLSLGTSIVSIWGHDPQTTRMAALTLQEATGGRFVLGMGVSHRHLAEKLRGHTYDRPLTRMKQFLAAYRTAVYRGPLPAGTPEPPVLLAALRDRMTDLAATDADGAFPYLVTAERLAVIRARLDSARGDGTRPLLAVTLPVVLAADASTARATARAYLAPYLRTPTYHLSWQLQGFSAQDWQRPGSDLLVDAMVAWGEEPFVRERIRALHAAGADHVAIIPLAEDGTTEDVPTVEVLAG